MLIAIKNRIIKSILILIIVLITTHNLQIIHKSLDSLIIRQNIQQVGIFSSLFSTVREFNDKRYESNQKISFYFLLTKESIYCNYLWRDLEFRVVDCQKYPLGSILRIIGTSTYTTASDEKGQKKLLIQSIKPVSYFSNSDIHLISFIMSFLTTFLYFVYEMKTFLTSTVEFYFSSRTQQLIIAMVLGDKSLLETDMRHIFKITGTLHVLAVSGMHVNLLYVLLQRLLSRFHRYLRFFTQVLILITYTIMVGASASVVRATSMLLYRLVGTDLIFKQINSSNSLFLVVLGMLVCNSWFITQVGFQLSVGATGVILFLLLYKKAIATTNSANSRENESNWAFLIGSVSSVEVNHSIPQDDEIGTETDIDLISRTLEGVGSYLKETAILGLVIQLFLAPVLWWHFGEASWVGILAGPATLWLVPPIYLLTLIYFIMFSFLEAISWVSTTIFSTFSTAMLFIPILLPLKITEFILHLVLIFLRLSIEIFSQLFLQILSVLTSFTQDSALIQWPNFSLTLAFIWYLILFTLFSLYWKYKKNSKIYTKIYPSTYEKMNKK